MAKKKLGAKLEAWNMCRLELGVKPFEKVDGKTKRALRRCVDEKTGEASDEGGRAKKGRKGKGRK